MRLIARAAGRAGLSGSAASLSHEGYLKPHVPPSQNEAWFLSSAHADRDINVTVEAARRAFAVLDATR